MPFPFAIIAARIQYNRGGRGQANQSSYSDSARCGAGTGLFTRLFAREVSPGGKVFAVDIAPKFIEHINKTCKEQGFKNVVGIVCQQDSVALPANSIDLAFICDTYRGMIPV